MRPLITVLILLAATPALAADESLQTGPETEKRFPPLKVPAGFKATLFACDPLIEYPSSIALGPRANTLFVAADYMTGLGTTDIIRRDEIRLVEDTDGDGYADKAPVWADRFNSIQGMTYHDGTVFVMHAPYLTALRDADNDGVADERKNLFKGFGLGPEDDKVRLHNANGIVAGHDGWLYLALGDRGCDVVRPEGDLLILNGGGILRCRPDGRDLHVFSTGLRNIYDVALDEDLNVFTRDNENDGGNYKIRVIQSFFGADHGYPYLYDERPDEALTPLADLGLGSSAGGVYYKETQFPPEYRSLYFCEWGRAVMRYEPQSLGKPFSPMKEIEFAAGAENDPYGFKPTDLVVDRDGSLLIADWADGQRPKRGRARIYRVQFGDRAPLPDQTSANKEPQGRARVPILQLADWIERLNSESYSERLEAQLAIEKLGRDDPVGVIDILRKNRNRNERASLHYVWILAHLLGTNATDELFKLTRIGNIFGSDTVIPRLRTQAIRALADLHDPVLAEHRLDAGRGEAKIAKGLASLVHWRHPGATFEVIVALGRMKWALTPLWMSEKLTWLEPSLEHAAQQALRRCGDWFAVLRLLDGSAQPPQTFLSGSSLKNNVPGQKPPQGAALRTVALRTLADQTDKEIVDGLVSRLKLEMSATRRREYADLLSRVHQKRSLLWVYWGFRPAPRPANTVAWERTELIEQTLDRLLADADRDVRLFVLNRMQREKIPTRLATLAEWLRDETDEKRLAAILESLREHPADAIREPLEAVIADTRQSTDARRMALRVWQTNLGDTREARLIALTNSVEDGELLAVLLNELGTLGTATTANESVASLLLSKTNSESALVRATAIDTIARRRIAGGAGAVARLLRDRDARVQSAAAFAAGQLEVRSAIPTLLELGTATDTYLRKESLDALRQLREPRVIPLATASVTDALTELNALRCISEFGGPEHADLVTRAALRGTSLEALLVSVEALTKWSERDGIDSTVRTALQRSAREIQGQSGVLVGWRVIGPVSADEAGRVIEAVDWTATSDRPDVGVRATNTRAFGEGPNARVGHVFNVPMKGGHVENVPQDRWLAVCEFDVAEAGAAQFLMSSNTPLRVWLNGKSVLDRAETRRFQPESDRFDAALVKGTNRVVVLLSNVSEIGWEFHARLRRKSSKVEHERLIDAALTRTGNIERGRKLFLSVEKSQCLKCHRLNDQGEKIGPELTGIGSRFSRVHIIESLLEPSRTIAAGFQAQTVELSDGRVLTGLKISETADMLVFADNQGKKHSLRKTEIEDSKAHAQSIMPDSLEKSLSLDEFVDLISFLTSEKQMTGR